MYLWSKSMNEPLTEEIAIWQTRSFWFAATTAVAVIAKIAGFEIDANYLADAAFNMLPLVTLALAYRERMAPKKKVVLGKAAK
jgi:hypothetical protein